MASRAMLRMLEGNVLRMECLKVVLIETDI